MDCTQIDAYVPLQMLINICRITKYYQQQKKKGHTFQKHFIKMYKLWLYEKQELECSFRNPK